MRDYDDLITTAESAPILKCVPDNVRKLARQGKLKTALIVGKNQRLFHRRDVEALARRMRRQNDDGEAA